MFLPQDFSNASDCSSSPNSEDESIEVGELLQDFLGGCLPMYFWVCWIIELLWHKVARVTGSGVLCFLNRRVHSFCIWRQNQIRAVCGKQVPAFFTHRVRHCEGQLIALHRRNKGEAYPGVSTRRLNNGHSWR